MDGQLVLPLLIAFFLFCVSRKLSYKPGPAEPTPAPVRGLYRRDDDE